MEYKKFKKKMKVNRHTVEATVTIKVEDDECPWSTIEDTYEEANKKRIQKEIEAGTVFLGDIIVTAEAEGLKAFDACGGFELKPNNAYDSGPFNKSVEQSLKDHDMVENALAELKKELENKYSEMTSYAQKFKKYSKGTKK